MRQESFGPDEIVIPPRLRVGINEASVASLMESIGKIGLQTPPTVRWDKDDGGEPSIVLVAGRHRLEACARLGMQLIPCVVFEGTDIEARLWEIAENLHRADLSVLERSEHVAEWIRLSEEELVQSAPVSARGRTEGRGNKGGVRAAVRELGIEHTAAVRATKIAGLSDEAKEAARDAGLDRKQAALLTAARAETPQEQVAEIRRLAEAKPVKPAPAPMNDIETEEMWMSAIMRVWNRGAPQWRERFIETVDAPVMGAA